MKKFATAIAALFLFLIPGGIQAFTSPADIRQQQTQYHLRSPVGSTGFAPFNGAQSVLSSTTLFGKKAARAQGNESKRKKERVKKPKDDVIEVDAVVLESLPNAMFRCAIDDAPETQEPVLATISGKIRKNFVKILVGDK
ncbi:MAG: hypothetical protein SGILL_000612, partial [Bacillariaceae sp.]